MGFASYSRTIQLLTIHYSFMSGMMRCYNVDGLVSIREAWEQCSASKVQVLLLVEI